MKENIENLRKLSTIDMMVNTMFVMMQGVDILQCDIDKRLRSVDECFHREKRSYYKKFMECMKQSWYWFEKFNITDAVWDASEAKGERFDSFRADANELLRYIMLYIDRSHKESSFYEIFRFLKNLPEQGLFTEADIARFNFKRPWVLGVGDVVNTRFGKAKLEAEANGDNWIVRLEDGTQKVLSAKSFEA